LCFRSLTLRPWATSILSPYRPGIAPGEWEAVGGVTGAVMGIIAHSIGNKERAASALGIPGKNLRCVQLLGIGKDGCKEVPRSRPGLTVTSLFCSSCLYPYPESFRAPGGDMSTIRDDPSPFSAFKISPWHLLAFGHLPDHTKPI
jgi:hypothetical protein